MNMNRLYVGIGIVLAILLVVSPVGALGIQFGNAGNNLDRPSVIIEEGKGREAGLIKVTHIHYAKSEDKGRAVKTVTCYKLAGWKVETPFTYTIDSSDNNLSRAVVTADEEWEYHASKDLFSSPVLSRNTPKPGIRDNTNSVTFGDYPSGDVIAVTYTWYNRATKLSVESDILFDTDFNWGDVKTDPSLMDLQNIATHEIGHTLGLSDLYTNSCANVTMYEYSKEGDVEKRSLEPADIAGLLSIYRQ